MADRIENVADRSRGSVDRIGKSEQGIAMQDAFSLSDVARMFSLKESRLRYWAQTGFINPSGRAAGRRAYTFGDLVEIKAAKELLEQKIPLQRVRRNLQALRAALPGKTQLLRRLRVRSNGDTLVVIDGETAVEPISGQLMLDFELSDVDSAVARVLELPRQEAPRIDESQAAPRRGPQALQEANPASPTMTPEGDEQPAEESAYGWFSRGLALEAQAGKEREAIAAYHKAIAIDSGLAAAQTNLGNLYYRCGERSTALRCYTTALALDPDQPEAHYNLANVYEEEGDLDLAIAEFRRALKLSPDFADAHFNLALTLERVGGRAQAMQHWQRYLELTTSDDASQRWRELAAEHLTQLKRSLV